jgi:succinoglycan biosynthesis transport protein ExoP
MLVDADLRKPNIHRFLQIQNRTGLSDLFLDNPGDVSKVCSWGETSIAVVPSGPLPPNPSELLGSEKFKQILNKLKENIDIMILDCAPSVVSDPIVLSSKVDGVLLIIKPGSTKMGAAQVLLEQFQRAGARVVGVVLNPISRKRYKYSSKSEYYSKYYQSSKSEHYYSEDGQKYSGNKKVTQRSSKDNMRKEDLTLPKSTN